MPPSSSPLAPSFSLSAWRFPLLNARMSWKVLITARTLNVEAVSRRALEMFHEAGCEVVHPPKYGPLSVSELQPLLRGMDAVLASMDKFTAEVLASPEAAQLKLISRWGVGYDAIDIPAATRSGIVVACGERALQILTVQREGAKRLAAGEFLNGDELKTGDLLR